VIKVDFYFHQHLKLFKSDIGSGSDSLSESLSVKLVFGQQCSSIIYTLSTLYDVILSGVEGQNDNLSMVAKFVRERSNR